ncbi:methyltransferase domain-containing protein [Halosimplex halobium]|uniref:methyltransferase domain-containing protein n=1 Tax=Halosimplex halobium TaxID=3396618 RepID=UPI003F57F267
MYVLELGGRDDEFAACEAASAAAGVEVVGAGLATARAVTDRVRDLAYVHRASEVVGHCDPDVASARALLDAATVDREGTVAVRAVDVRATTGVDTQRAERELGQVLVDRGLSVDLEDPDHELRALFAGAPGADSTATEAQSADEATAEPTGGAAEEPTGGAAEEPTGGAAGGTGICVLGWLGVESDRGFGERRPTDRPFFQPGSMDPMLARALVNIAGAREGATVVDPMCGTGGLLLEAGLVGARVVGSDAQRKMVRGTRANLRDALDADGDFAVCRGDVTRLPFFDDFADAAVFDVPYGRQSKIEGDSLADLVAGALAEARRVAPRAVVVADRSWERAAVDAGWTVAEHFERRVHRSLVRHVLVLDAD